MKNIWFCTNQLEIQHYLIVTNHMPQVSSLFIKEFINKKYGFTTKMQAQSESPIIDMYMFDSKAVHFTLIPIVHRLPVIQ